MAHQERIDKAAWDIWMSDPVTKAVFKSLKEYRDALEQGKNEGDCLDYESMQRSILQTVHRRGVIEGFDFFLEMKHETEITDIEAYFYDNDSDESSREHE